jgi:hypothetical protein
MQALDLVGNDGAAAAAVHAHVTGALLPEPVDQVREELHVTALVRRDRHGIRVLLDHGGHDLVHRAVVAQVDDLAALLLEQAAHDVDGRVVPIEQGGGGHDAYRQLGPGRRDGCGLAHAVLRTRLATLPR